MIKRLIIVWYNYISDHEMSGMNLMPLLYCACIRSQTSNDASEVDTGSSPNDQSTWGKG